jgi:periodic tryptophan protein 1
MLDDAELERVSALAHIELEDARVELERAQKAASSMDRRSEDEEEDEAENDGDWVE